MQVSLLTILLYASNIMQTNVYFPFTKFITDDDNKEGNKKR